MEVDFLLRGNKVCVPAGAALVAQHGQVEDPGSLHLIALQSSQTLSSSASWEQQEAGGRLAGPRPGCYSPGLEASLVPVCAFKPRPAARSHMEEVGNWPGQGLRRQGMDLGGSQRLCQGGSTSKWMLFIG